MNQPGCLMMILLLVGLSGCGWWPHKFPTDISMRSLARTTESPGSEAKSEVPPGAARTGTIWILAGRNSGVPSVVADALVAALVRGLHKGGVVVFPVNKGQELLPTHPLPLINTLPDPATHEGARRMARMGADWILEIQNDATTTGHLLLQLRHPPDPKVVRMVSQRWTNGPEDVSQLTTVVERLASYLRILNKHWWILPADTGSGVLSPPAWFRWVAESADQAPAGALELEIAPGEGGKQTTALLQQLESRGYIGFVRTVRDGEGKPRPSVRLGRYANREDAELARTFLETTAKMPVRVATVGEP